MSTSGLTPGSYGSILLTKLDRLTRDIIMAQIGTIEFDPTKTALLVVDMQNAFLDHRGSHGKLGLNTTLLEKTIGPVKALVDACHEVKITGIFTRGMWRSDYKDGGRLLDIFPGLREVSSMVAGTWDVEVDERIGVEPDDFIVDKPRCSAFYNTNLEVILRGLKVDTLIVCGVTTEMCVESTIRDAFFRDFQIIVPQDAVASEDTSTQSC